MDFSHVFLHADYADYAESTLLRSCWLASLTLSFVNVMTLNLNTMSLVALAFLLSHTDYTKFTETASQGVLAA